MRLNSYFSIYFCLITTRVNIGDSPKTFLFCERGSNKVDLADINGKIGKRRMYVPIERPDASGDSEIASG
jgi:hypothetical protein